MSPFPRYRTRIPIIPDDDSDEDMPYTPQAPSVHPNVDSIASRPAPTANQGSLPLLPSATSSTTLKPPTSQSTLAQSTIANPDYALRKITHIEGSIQAIPQRILAGLQKWCNRHETNELPCAGARWKTGNSIDIVLNRRTKETRSRRWITVPDGEEPSIGRFRYEGRKQIVVVQAPSGSKWKGGEVVIIVNTTKSAAASRSGTEWKVWRGETLIDDIPDIAGKVLCQFVPLKEDPGEETLVPQRNNDESGNFAGSEVGSEVAFTRPHDHRTTAPSGIVPSSAGKTEPLRRKSYSAAADKIHDLYLQTDLQQAEIDNSLSSGPTIEITGVQNPLSSKPKSVPPSASLTQTNNRDDSSLLDPESRKRYRADSLDSDAPLASQKSKWRIAGIPAPSSAAQPPRKTPKTVHFEDTTEIVQSPFFSKEDEDETLVADGSRTDSDLAMTIDIDHVRVKFMHPSGEVLQCLLGELENINAIFARARVADVVSKTDLLLEVKVGERVILLQKRFDQDYERLKAKVSEEQITEILIYPGS